MDRSLVVFVSPPHFMGTNAKSFPSLGILSLASHVRRTTPFDTAYFDGAVCPKDVISGFIASNHRSIFAVCGSLITSNMAAGLKMCAEVKALDPAIRTIVGNDAFSSMPERLLKSQPAVDYGFTGNEVYGSLSRFLTDQRNGPSAALNTYPGLAWRNGKEVVVNPGVWEPVAMDVDYSLIDRHFGHSRFYDANFQNTYGNFGKRLPDRLAPKRAVTVEIARGCVKFNGNNACSFCSIQPGGLARNSSGSADAWFAIEKAAKAGYDTLLLTADELPLTFPSLLRDMANNQPDWWKATPEHKRPVLFGYARADGLQREVTVGHMRASGFRILFVGIDAGDPVSLLGMNKVLQRNPTVADAERLFDANFKTIENMRKHGMVMFCGFVLGHIGMTQELLAKNVAHAKRFMDQGRDVIAGIDFEILSPEVGSRDYKFLTDPKTATATAQRLSLTIAPEEERQAIAARYADAGAITVNTRANAKRDYVRAFMPELKFENLRAARTDLIRHALARSMEV